MTINPPQRPQHRAHAHHNRTKREIDRQAFDAWFAQQFSDKEENRSR